MEQNIKKDGNKGNLRHAMKHIFFSSRRGVLGCSLISADFSTTPDSPVNDD